MRDLGGQLKFAMDLAGMQISMIDLEGKRLSWREFSAKHFRDLVEEVTWSYPSTPIQLKEDEFKRIRKAVERKGMYDGEVELSSNSGSRALNRLIVTKLSDKKGAHIGFICITKDMAGKREWEEWASKKDKELEDFIYTVCHDLRTPLCAIEGYSSLLAEEYKDVMDDEGRDYLCRITDNTVMMANLIDQLKEYSCATKPTEPCEKIDLSEVARAALANINEQLDGRNVTCTIHNLPTVYGEKSKMVQVFNHLLESSIKSSNNEIPTIEIACEEEGHMYQVSVREGKGVERGNHNKVMQMVHCLSGGSNYFVAGLGLAIAKKIVENHGGSVWAESEQKKGAAFCFTLPKGKNRSTWNDEMVE